MKTITNDKKIAFYDQFIDSFTTPSFGALPKKEIELLVLRLLVESGFFGDKFDSYTMSRKLRIPVNKAKNLFYEYQLRFTDDSNDLIIELLSKAKVSFQDKRPIIEIEVDSLFVRNKFESLVRDSNGIVDYSFNRNILKFNTDTYFSILEKIYEKQKIDSLIKQITAVINSEAKEHEYKTKSKEELFDIFIASAMKTAGKESVKIIFDLSFGGFSNIKNTLDGFLNNTKII